MSTNAGPPVADHREEVMCRLFQDLQVARFNQIYYQERAASLRRLTASAGIVSALAASSAFVSILKGSGLGGSAMWLILTAAAAVCSAVVPVLHLDERASRLEQAALGHGLIRDRLFALLRDLKLAEFDEGHAARIREIDAFCDGLSALNEKPVESVLQRSWQQALREYPAEQAWTII